MGDVILKMRNISKNFPGVLALDKVDFSLRSGEIHALMGENGAGKSTLIKVLTGAEAFESGEIFLSGIDAPIINASPSEAQNRGISTVYQEVNLCPNLTVAENLFVGRQPMKGGFVSWREMKKRARAVMESLNIHIDVEKPLEIYSVAVQQMVAIARAVDISAKVLILDEPTSSLDDNEVLKLFDLMRNLKDQGLGIIFITHFLEQVYEICDTITVLRNGQLVGEYEIEKLPRIELVSKMLGKAFDDLASIKSEDTAEVSRDGDPLISAKEVEVRGSVRPFDMDVYPGEVVGLAGLLGSGRTELARAIFGADMTDAGAVSVKGKKIGKRPIDAMNAGMAFCPENRKVEGVVAELSVRENLILAEQTKRGALRRMSRSEQQKLTEEYIKLLQIKTASAETPIKQLSGGNQQKVILAREIDRDPKLLIAVQPTRGLDVGAIEYIHKQLLAQRDSGKAVLLISLELEEVMNVSDRILVMYEGEIVADVNPKDVTFQELGLYMSGAKRDKVVTK